MSAPWPAAAAKPPLLDTVVERIVAGAHPLKIILFGSWARGSAGPDSDMDLLVVMPKLTHKREQAVKILSLLCDLPLAKDVVVTSPDEISRRGDLPWDILFPALREGRVIYEA